MSGGQTYTGTACDSVINQYDALVFKIRSKASWGNNRGLQIYFINDSTGQTSAGVLLLDGRYGFVSSVTTVYQNVTIPLPDFGANGLNGITRIVFARTNGGGNIGFYMDDIQLLDINDEQSGSQLQGLQDVIVYNNVFTQDNVTELNGYRWDFRQGKIGIQVSTNGYADLYGTGGGDLNIEVARILTTRIDLNNLRVNQEIGLANNSPITSYSGHIILRPDQPAYSIKLTSPNSADTTNPILQFQSTSLNDRIGEIRAFNNSSDPSVPFYIYTAGASNSVAGNMHLRTGVSLTTVNAAQETYRYSNTQFGSDDIYLEPSGAIKLKQPEQVTTTDLVLAYRVSDSTLTMIPADSLGSSGAGTVTSFAFTNGSGFTGSVTNATTTPTLALTTSLTTGSVPFIGASGALSEDNATLFWDNSSKELGIGTNAPGATLDVRSASTTYLFQMKTTAQTYYQHYLTSGNSPQLYLSSQNGDQEANMLFSSGGDLSNLRPNWVVGKTGGNPNYFKIRGYYPSGAFYEEYMNITAGGETVFNEGGLDRDIRFESDANTHMLFVDAGSNTVSVGTSTTAATFTVNGTMQSGLAGTTIGGYLLAGNTSGVISILPQAAAGTFNFNLPITAGTSGYLLTSGGGGATAMTWTDPATLGNTYTASEGLTLVTADFQLGGTVSTDRTLTLGTNTILMTANTLAGDPALSITSTSTAAASDLQKGINVSLSGANGNNGENTYGIYSSNTHTGTTSQNFGVYGTATGGTFNYGVYGESDSWGVYGRTTSGTAVYADATSGGTGLQTNSTTGTALLARTTDVGGLPISASAVSSTTNTALNLFRITRTTSGTAADGIGASIRFDLQTDGGSTLVSNSFVSKLTTASAASATSQLIITGLNSTAQTDILSFEGNKRVLLYGRLEMQQGADVASVAGAIALGLDGNSFEITGTNAITLISNLNWQNGSEITFVFASTATLTDGTANSGTDIGMELAGNTNFTASAGATIKLQLLEQGGTTRWREVSRSIQ